MGFTTTTLLNSSDRLLSMSADGQLISYVETSGGTQTLYVLNVTTSTRTAIDTASSTSTTGIDGGVLSANGQFIYYSKGLLAGNYEPNNASISLFEKDLSSSSGPVDVTPTVTAEQSGAPWDILPEAVSNDGLTLVYDVSYSDNPFTGASHYVVAFGATGTSQNFQSDQPVTAPVSLSPDGRYFAYADFGSHFYVADLQGQTQSTFTNTGAPYNYAAVSSDGRYVVYTQTTDQAGGSNNIDNIVVVDRNASPATPVTITRGLNGTVADGSSTFLALSGDGRHVLFESRADNLVANDTDGASDLFVVDLDTGVIQLVEVNFSTSPFSDPKNGAAYISYDGSQIFAQQGNSPVNAIKFTAPALTVNAVSGDDLVNAKESYVLVSGTSDAVGQTVYLTVPGEPGAAHTATAIVQSNQTWAAFLNIGPPPTGGNYNIEATVTSEVTTTVDHPFAVDDTPPSLTLHTVAGDNIVNAAEAPSIEIDGTSDADGQLVKLSVDGKSIGTPQVDQNGNWTFQYNGTALRDGQHEIEYSVSDPAGNVTSHSAFFLVDKTPPKIGITSVGDNGVVSTTEYRNGVVVKGTSDGIGGTVHLADASGHTVTGVVAGNGTWQTTLRLSGDPGGPNQLTATITDEAGNVGSATTTAMVDTGIIDVSAASPGVQDNLYGYYDPRISSNGQAVAYDDSASIYVKNLQTGAYTVVTQTTDGMAPNGGLWGSPVLSEDGQHVAYYSFASNLVAGANSGLHVFVTDVTTGITQMVDTDSTGAQVNPISDDGPLGPPAISADGRYVVFASDSNGELIPGVTGTQVYRKDAQTGAITLVSQDSAGNTMAGYNYDPSVSADGNLVTFNSPDPGGYDDPGRPSDAQHFGFTNPASDVFERNISGGTLTLVSMTPQGGSADDASAGSLISPDGKYVEFTTLADDLVSGDANFTSGMNTVVRKLAAGDMTSLTDGIQSPDFGASPVFSFTTDDGFVTFDTQADIDPSDPGSAAESYIYNLATGDRTVVLGKFAQLSGDGHYVAFQSQLPLTTDSVAGQPNIYLEELQPHSITVAPVTGDDRIDQSEVHNVPLSGTCDLISGTVTIFVDGAKVTSTTVTSGGTWITDIDMSTYGATSHTILATVTDSAGFTADAEQVVQIPVASGQTVTVTSGQTSAGQTVLSGGQVVVASGGTASGATISSGGSETVGSGGTTVDTAVSRGGILAVSSGGVADPTSVNSGGSEVVVSGATDLGAVISGGKQVDFGVTSGVTIYSGGLQIVRAGGVASGSIVSSGGVFSDFGTAAETLVGSGGSEVVQPGGVETGAVVSNSGIALIEAHGVTNGLAVWSGGVAANSGGSASGTVVSNGGLDFLEAGSVETGAILSSGGIEFIHPGGTALGLTVLSGGVAANSGGSASGTIIDDGGLDFVQSGSIETNATLSGGIAYINAGGTALGLMVSSGGVAANFGGSASGTIVSSGGLGYLEPGAVDIGARLASGGIEFIEVGGTALGLRVSDGGIAATFAGSASGTVVLSGGQDYLESGAIETGATLSGGVEFIEGGGTALGLMVASGGIIADFGGSASGAIVGSGGQDYLESGAIETGAMLAGGVEFVSAGGMALGLTVASGGIVANFGGSASGTIVSGQDYLESGAVETGASLASGGVEFISAGGFAGGLTVGINATVAIYGGSASGTIVSSGGHDFLESRAVETSATINRFGAEFIGSGATAIGVTASGLVNMASGGVISGTVTFGPRGQLQLADSQDFTNLVAGFSGINVKLDLQDITYVASGANATTINWTQLASGASGSGTLTVSQGGHAANITLLGQYATSNFVISSDGGAGTLVIDPPLAPVDSATVFVNPRHG